MKKPEIIIAKRNRIWERKRKSEVLKKSLHKISSGYESLSMPILISLRITADICIVGTILTDLLVRKTYYVVVAKSTQ